MLQKYSHKYIYNKFINLDENKDHGSALAQHYGYGSWGNLVFSRCKTLKRKNHTHIYQNNLSNKISVGIFFSQRKKFANCM